MPDKPLIMAIDQGTTSSRAIVFDPSGAILAVAQEEFQQHYPADGWVEHEPEDIWDTVVSVSRKAIAQAEDENPGTQVVAIGITNQRETTIVWDKKTGKAIYKAIVWQDRRTAAQCEQLRNDGFEEVLTKKTGLLLDPYFSATKIAWILDHVEGARNLAKQDRLAFGTIDAFLIWRLNGGNVHATDITNASRTNLFNIHTQQWDDELLARFNVPASLMPQVRECSDDYGATSKELFGRSIPILGVAGDQQAASIGQACFSPGSIKSTYGTGCFVLVNTGDKPVASKNNLLTTIAYKINGQVHYAIEGSIFIAGAGVQWLRDELGIISNAAETESLARSLADNGGVYLVPAFTGLGAPHWDPHARGALYGLTRGAGRAHFARAALEAVVYQTADLLKAIVQDGVQPKEIRVDGGMVLNDWTMQFLADILDLGVERPVVMETTALGVATMAGLKAGIYESVEEIAKLWQRNARFNPAMTDTARARLLEGWDKAVARTRSS